MKKKIIYSKLHLGRRRGLSLIQIITSLSAGVQVPFIVRKREENEYSKSARNSRLASSFQPFSSKSLPYRTKLNLNLLVPESAYYAGLGLREEEMGVYALHMRKVEVICF